MARRVTFATLRAPMPACPKCAHENPEIARFCGKCGSMLDAPRSDADPLIGKVVADRYRIVRAIGEGGMGRVYLAEQRMGATTRRVAVKVLSTSMNDQHAVARFYRECETVVQLEHPNTIRFYDFGHVTLTNGERSEDRLYIAMEYVDGPSLAELITRGPLSIETVDRLVRQIAGALGEAHRRGIVHRDLKPENVLVAKDTDDQEVAKVLDFGIAKQASATAAEVTAQGTLLGTPAYMSPEQLSGQPTDERSDVYALALVTFEMLTGKRAFEASSPIQWANAHMKEAPRSFDDFAATRGLSAERRAAVMHGLAKDRAERTPSATRFVEEFCRADRASPPAAMTTSNETPALPRSSSGAVVIAGALAIGLGAVIAVGGWLYLRPQPTTTIAPVPDAGSPMLVDAAASPAPHDAGPPQPFWLTIMHHQRGVLDEASALGAPDGQCATIEPHGMITLTFSPDARVSTDHGPGADLRVVLDDARSGPYRLEVGVDHDTFAIVADEMVGGGSIDVDPADVSGYRFVRISNRASAGTVCLDAVGAWGVE